MDPTTAPAAPAGHDFSFLGLFLQADPIVKGVMILLVLASVVSWTIIIEKVVRIAGARRQAKAFARLVASGGMPEARSGIPARVVGAAQEAWRDQDASETRAERRERIERAMRAVLTLDLKRLQIGLPFLASAGSAAPFIGLFGTVWGIMNSFSSIAKSQDTSLAVVAPGIAEALFATAIGLVVAIPAVLAYNKFSTDLAKVQASFVSGIGILGNRLARDRGHHARSAAAE
ncbi:MULTISPECIES: MotA/TolQ/ExbB proton channel family protein [Methylobacterium]|jgi:biopolymer transport protein TolQ|uniref:MotA/TolQ/ExbB proton channel family protein n=1 Tax=Methylobacterium TaxID=407 RepID=UPI0008E3D3C8|nr:MULTISPECIES: MotA/TolQ/ExbB proton channel family protein [Methylobacterium]MBZ6412990.1 MotA/TolQ/ExbB proton channel family protein [Methylobacterium sp.]MBK3395372.1 MotA/TolQ/ExbB proton channel family protein [Methylobacterium ajmalii]MBK3407892.1 MotA/TolQ/ExbB proton channel family protein [Methylobacterium ajmalii]MBK3425937.1 MotA/TolQ/ExbB proton channel family protein [Methylobacterium ajmalii]SFE98266.1 Cell division and transport-associated protein TolQ [Methylobacterium sp. y